MKKRTKKLLMVACVGICALALAACGKGKSFSAGVEMNAEEARAYRERLLAQKAEEEKAEDAVTSEDVPADEIEEGDELPDVCYYTANGGVWHYARSCSYLRNAEDILNGSVESAALLGKVRPCSRCASMFAAE